MRRHAGLMVGWLGEDKGAREFRKHVSWYLKGFAVGGEVRQQLALVSSLAELDRLLDGLDLTQDFPHQLLGTPRGRLGPPRRVALPEGWLDTREEDGVPVGADAWTSGG